MFTALHPQFGVEVHDVDLRDVTATAGYPQLRAAFEEHSLLLFREQRLDDEAQLAFGALWGTIEDRSPRAEGESALELPPHIASVSNRLDDGSVAPADDLVTLDLTGNQLWHTDSTFLPVPALANILAARVLSSSGGETELVSTRTAWRDMSRELREFAQDAFVRHRLAHSRAGISEELVRRHLERWPDQVWRAVWRNPVTGDDALYLASHATAIEGMDLEDGRRRLRELIDFCTTADRIYTHRWQPGDVLVWDERATLHRGRPWPYDEERTLASICISASEDDGLASIRPPI